VTTPPGNVDGEQSDAPGSPPPPVRRVRRRRPVPWHRRHRTSLAVSSVVVLVLIGLGVWFAVTALSAKSDLQDARAHVQAARSDLEKGDSAAAQREVDLAANNTSDARASTSALPWDLLAPIPVLGNPLRTTRDIAAAVDDLVVQVLKPAAAQGTALSPDKLRTSGSQIDLAALTRARLPLQQAAANSIAVQHRIDAIPAGGWLGSVEAARTSLQQQSAELTSLLRNASTAAILLPPMLGVEGPRNYFLAFQTNAEARGTGGLVGAYGIVTANQGKVALDTLASNRDLKFNGKPIDLGPDFAALYGNYKSTTSWSNSNISPNVPYAGQIWKSLWQQQSGQQIDGAIATDPVALSYILGAVGPVTLPSGEVIDANNVVRITESDVYLRFPDDNKARKDFLQSIAEAVVMKTLGGQGGSTVKLLQALGRAAGEGRLGVWSDMPGEEAVLADTALGRVVPDDAAPYANVVVNNASGNKIDYYLDRKVRYSADNCVGPLRSTAVAITLTNELPPGNYPPYITGRQDPNPTGPPGTSRSLVSLYATQGAELRQVTLDGAPIAVTTGSERGHPVYTANVQLPPGVPKVLLFSMVEPTAPGEAQVPTQPLVGPMATSVNVPTCAVKGP
jgi:hypothetical protein